METPALLQRARLLSAGLCALLLVACSGHRGGGVNVDEVQGHVNAVEKHLRNMRGALQARDVDKANDEYGEAREVLAENRQVLAAYPEMSELEASVKQAGSDLCFGSVSLKMVRFFELIRAAERDEAKESLDAARVEFKRCKPEIEHREDYLPLKMNIDSAPEALSKLDEKLSRPVRLARIRKVGKGLDARKAALRSTLAGLERHFEEGAWKKAVAELDWLKRNLKSQGDFGGDPEWTRYAAGLQGELAEMEGKLHERRARFRLLRALDELREADRLSSQAQSSRDLKAGRRMLDQAKVKYGECAAGLVELFGLGEKWRKLDTSYKKKKRSAAWLERHCKSAADGIEQLKASLGKKKAKGKKKKPRKRRRRDVRRW
ncbi:MAG: hypothetical protein JXR96_23745 [Deltaproteobacteria bacterium]|nr:hypothetical protein [Deltaproteobacteria bacterium]